VRLPVAAITGRLQDNLKEYTNVSRMLVPAKTTVRLRYALSSLLGMHMYMYNQLATLCLHNTTALALAQLAVFDAMHVHAEVQLDLCLRNT
jgi:hypothetical protein